MDVDHNLIVSKSRCPLMADLVANRPDASFFLPYVNWLKNASSPASKDLPPVSVDSPASSPSLSSARSWSSAQIQSLLRSGLVTSPQNAVALLNLSLLSADSSPDLCLSWAQRYRQHRTALKLDPLKSAQMANDEFSNHRVDVTLPAKE